MRFTQLFRCLFLLALFILALPSDASHVMGSEILYECTGNGTYKVTVKVYRDCNGINVSPSALVARSMLDSVTVTNQTKISVKDITFASNDCQLKSRCTGTYPYGIEEHVWEMNLDLSSYSNCEWTLIWQQCCRNGNITTGQASQNFYTTAQLNKCLTTCNSSPVFKNSPSAVTILCVNRDVVYDNGAMDTLDHDSLSYHLATPLQFYNTNATYSGQFSPTRPLTFWGYPNPNLLAPAGFHLDPVTGILRFRPVQINQVAIIVVEVKEWRNINGTMTEIGSIRRDMQVIVANCSNNKAPLISGFNSARVCPGDRICFSIQTNDLDAADSVKLSWDNGLPGASFTTTNNISRLPQGEICWTPDSSHVDSLPHRFKVFAKDNDCFYNGISEREYTVYVQERDSQMQLSLQAIPGDCGYYYFSHSKSAEYDGYQSYYLLKDSTNTVIWSTNRVRDSLFLNPGTYTLSLQSTATNFCLGTASIQFTVADTSTQGQYSYLDYCIGSSVTLNTNRLINHTMLNYTWYRANGTLDSLGFGQNWPLSASDSGRFLAKANWNNCVFEDTFDLVTRHVPNIQLWSDKDTICPGSEVTFGDPHYSPYPLQHLWNWNTIDTSTQDTLSVRFWTADTSLWVRLAVRNPYNCVDLDSIQIWILAEIELDTLPNLFLTPADSQLLSLGAAQIGVSYQWQADTGTGFFDIQNNTFYRGVNSSSLWIAKPNKTMDGYRYRCIAHQLECTVWSDTSTLSVSSGTAALNPEFEQFTVYPNPAENLLYVDYPGLTEPMSVQIFNNAGQLVQRFELKTSLQGIDISDLAPGVYFLKLGTPEEMGKRFIKQ
ncbi:MAG: T9SS type A sorting domain-containing protein [Bacteroidetes bacterium]|nr:MAG: T9SS type A sorting domain-containing protein [Bacteroidota bacterium]